MLNVSAYLSSPLESQKIGSNTSEAMPQQQVDVFVSKNGGKQEKVKASFLHFLSTSCQQTVAWSQERLTHGK